MPVGQAVEPSELRANWRILVAATVGTALGLPSVPFYTIGIFAPILAKTFGWSFASIFGGLSITAATLLVGSAITGLLVDRYGARRVATISLFGLGLSYISLSLSTGSLVQYYASWVAMAVTGLGATFVSFTEAVNAAFARQRGFALGVTLAGSGLFILFVKPFAHLLLVIFGWRLAIVGIGLLPLVVGVLAVRWGFPKHLTRAGKVATSKQAAVGLTLGQALRTRAFWLMIFILVPISFASAAPFPNMENILRSVRLDAKYVVELTSLLGAMMIVGRLLGGWMMDRIWAPLVGLIFVLGAAVGSWFLTMHMVSNTRALAAIILLGLAAGSEGGLMSFLAVRYFGVKHYGVIYGLIFGIFAVGAAAGPSLFGYAYDKTGSYAQILTVCTGLFVFAAVLLAFLGRYPDLSHEDGSK